VTAMTPLDLLQTVAGRIGGIVEYSAGAWRVLAGGVQLAAGATPTRALVALSLRSVS